MRGFTPEGATIGPGQACLARTLPQDQTQREMFACPARGGTQISPPELLLGAGPGTLGSSRVC